MWSLGLSRPPFFVNSLEEAAPTVKGEGAVKEEWAPFRGADLSFLLPLPLWKGKEKSIGPR